MRENLLGAAQHVGTLLAQSNEEVGGFCEINIMCCWNKTFHRVSSELIFKRVEDAVLLQQITCTVAIVIFYIFIL